LQLRRDAGTIHGIALCDYLSGLQLQSARSYADRRLSLHLRLQTLQLSHAAH
jgi:hypothetical protein